jgi:hypothetical protein
MKDVVISIEIVIMQFFIFMEFGGKKNGKSKKFELVL